MLLPMSSKANACSQVGVPVAGCPSVDAAPMKLLPFQKRYRLEPSPRTSLPHLPQAFGLVALTENTVVAQFESLFLLRGH